MNESEIDLDNLPLAEALSFADEGSTTGGLLTHAALKTLAAGCRELTAARAEIEAIMETLKSPIEVELDMIRGKIAIPDRSELDYITQLKAVTEQRDRLAEALERWPEIRKWLEMSKFISGYMQAEKEFFDQLSEALAAVKGEQ